MPPVEYDLSVITKILPHRSPFLFVDRVVDLMSNERIVAEKDLSPDLLFFEGHFPGRPMMPGVLVAEALAQASGLLIGLACTGPQDGPDRPGRFLLANVDIRFSRPAHPGDTLRLESTLKKRYGTLFLFMVCATVRSAVIARGELTLAGTR
jgi:3-hydroxyacyl-[acyl-carrier-protein] dehydratase